MLNTPVAIWSVKLSKAPANIHEGFWKNCLNDECSPENSHEVFFFYQFFELFDISNLKFRKKSFLDHPDTEY